MVSNENLVGSVPKSSIQGDEWNEIVVEENITVS